MLLIGNDDVSRLLAPRDTIGALEEAYADLAAGEAVCRPRIDVRMPTGDGRTVYQWGSMEGGSSRSGYFAVRVKSDVLVEREYAGTRTQEKYCTRPGLYCGLVWLFSARDGAPLALINDGVLQHQRVGADAAIGARHLARPGTRVLGMLGSGGMARSHLAALHATFPLERVQVFSPTQAHREQYAAEAREQYGIDAVAVADPALVYRGADLVAGCADAVGEVVKGGALEPGTHVVCAGGRLDRAAYERIDVWLRLGDAPAPDGRPEWRTAAESVAYVARPEDPVWSRHHARRHERRPPAPRTRVVRLAELLAGSSKGRARPEEITFSERGNIQGAQFFAVAGRVYELARKHGLGRELPDDWLLQTVRD